MRKKGLVTFGLKAALALLALLLPPHLAMPARARQFQDSPLRYQKRGNRYEGVVAPADDHNKPVSLLSLTAYDRSVDRPEEMQLFTEMRVGFYLPSRKIVSLEVTNLSTPPALGTPPAAYRMDKVVPARRWQDGAYNYFAWPTWDVIGQLGFTGSKDLGFVARLESGETRPTQSSSRRGLRTRSGRRPARTTTAALLRDYAAPVTPYYSEFPDRINTYSFTFKVGARPVSFALYRCSNSSSDSAGGRLVNRWIGTYVSQVAQIEWQADAALSGCYYIEAAEYFGGSAGRPLHRVIFNHRRIVSFERYYQRELVAFKSATVEVIGNMEGKRRALKVIPLPQGVQARPASYAVGSSGQQRQRVLAYEADAVRQLLREGREYIDTLTGYMFSGIREYMEGEYPSEESIPTVPDPRNPRRQLVLKVEADKILDKALALLREINSLPSLYVIVNVESIPDGAAASLITHGGKGAGSAVTPGRILYLPRGRYLFQVSLDGFKDFNGEFNFMRSRVNTSVGCILYAVGEPHKSRCNNPE